MGEGGRINLCTEQKVMAERSKAYYYFWMISGEQHFNTGTYLQNHLAIKKMHVNKTPVELWCGRKPNSSHWKVLGCRVDAYLSLKKKRMN